MLENGNKLLILYHFLGIIWMIYQLSKGVPFDSLLGSHYIYGLIKHPLSTNNGYLSYPVYI